ncbi:MAG: DUF4386 domain-containing protein [Paracoccaceae bacterium]|nr:DUF4386 domain-containing protein [Maritimibacter sp.]
MTHPTYRQNAIFAGIFFIIATALLFVAEPFYRPALTGPDVLTAAAAAKSRVAAGILIDFTCALAIPLIAISLYPVLRRVSASLAVGYVGFRVLEAAILAQLQADRMFVLTLSDLYAARPGADPETLALLVMALVGGEAWSGASGPIYNLAFVIGMLMLNWALWTSRLVPRWISGWGLVTAVVLGVLALLVPFVEIPVVLAVVLITPLAVQEMVLALWFIAKGFDMTAVAQLA